MGYLTHVLVSCLILQTLALTYGFNIAEAGLGASSGGEPEERGTSCTRPALTDSHTDLADFNNQALAWHNYLRCVHNAPALTLNQALIDGSQIWAAKIAKDQALSHDNSGDGENVCFNTDSRYGAYVFVRGVYNTWVNNGVVWGYKGSWYCGEYEALDFNNPESNTQNTGHLTQIIWKGTTSVGCGVVKGVYQTYGAAYYVVCRYSPGGNTRGDYFTNIQDYITGYSYATVCPTPSS